MPTRKIIKNLLKYTPFLSLFLAHAVQSQTECKSPDNRLFASGYEEPIDELFAIQERNFSAPAPNGFGKAFGTPFVGQVHSISNTFDSGVLQSLTIKAYKFVAPANLSGRLQIGSNNGAQVWAISRSCGQWPLDSRCKGYYGGTTLSWATNGGAGCPLNPGQTYYFQVAYFNWSLLGRTGIIESTCGGTCSYSTGSQIN